MLIDSKIKFHMLEGVKISRYVTCMCCFCISDLINLKIINIRTAMECRLNNLAWDYLNWNKCVSYLIHLYISIFSLAWIFRKEEMLEKVCALKKKKKITRKFGGIGNTCHHLKPELLCYCRRCICSEILTKCLSIGS